jgi:hypothetical protein
MKKILLSIFCILIYDAINAQSNSLDAFIAREKKQTEFKTVNNLFTIENRISAFELSKYTKGATQLKLDLTALSLIIKDNDRAIRFSLTDNNGKTYDVDLAQYDIFSNGYLVKTNINGIENIFPYEKGLYYRGVVNGIEGSIAAISFFNDALYGVFAIPGVGNFNIVPNTLLAEQNKQSYLLYNDHELTIPNNFSCGTDPLPILSSSEGDAVGSRNTFNSCKNIDVYLKADFATYQSNSSNVTTTVNYLSSLYNVIATLYRNEGIYTSLKTVVVNTASDTYAGLATNSSMNFLNAFGQETQNNLQGADLAHLVSTLTSGNMGGVAWMLDNGVTPGITELCNNYSTNGTNHFGPYAFTNINSEAVQNFPIYSWNVEAMTHEMGHNLGSPHTHACKWNGNNTAIDGCGPTFQSNLAEGNCALGPIPSNAVKGTIMSYCHLLQGQSGLPNVGINLANGFGPQPSAHIIGQIASSSCATPYAPNTTLAINNNNLLANRECTNGAITYYWNDNNNSDSTDDVLVLRLEKGANDIGNLDEVGFEVKTGYTATNASINLPNYPSSENNNTAMRRFWNVTPTFQPITTVKVSFPFTTADVSNIQTAAGTTVVANNLKLYKTSVDPNPDNGLTGSTTANTQFYEFISGATPTLTNWTLSTSGSTQYANFLVNSFSGGSAFFNNPSPLSTNFLYFTGKKLKEGVQLEWKMEDIQEVNEFIIYRGSDAKNYQRLAVVNSHHVSSTLIYNYLDEKYQQGNNHYRLNYITKDGVEKVAGFATVNVMGNFSINVYPNPVKNQLNIAFNTNPSSAVHIKLMDINGRMIYQKESTESMHSIDLNNIASGIYMLQIINGQMQNMLWLFF